MNYFSTKKHKESGFVILFSILISTIILTMSAGIFQIAQKENILSSYSRESQTAFYAADAAVECALYWDISTLESATIFDTLQASGSQSPSFNCGSDINGDSVSISAYKYDATALYDHVFGFRYANLQDGLGCAFVFVEKNNANVAADPSELPEPSETRITAIGYNVCEGNSPDIDDPSLIERRLSVSYRSR